MRKAIDWLAVKERVAQNQLAAEGANNDAGRTATVFEQRAKRLAERRTVAEPESTGMRVLTFSLGAQKYAIEHAQIVEILPLREFTPIPGAAPELLGVINLRGEILTVLDLSRLLEISGSTEPSQGYILVLRRQELGFKVDSVSQIKQFLSSEIDAGLAAANEHTKRFIKGITRDTTLILCVETILTHSIFETV